MAISFSCHICSRTLTTSDDKAGRQAKCPGCGTVLTVPDAPVSDSAAAAPGEAGGTADADDTEQPAVGPAAIATVACPMCGAQNPPRAKRCQSCGEALQSESLNREKLAGRKLDLGKILEVTWNIFKDNLALTVGGSIIALLPLSIGMLLLLGPAYVALIMADQNQQMPLEVFLVCVPLGLIFGLIGCYLMPGYTLLMLGVARGDDVSLGTLVQGNKYFIRYFLCTVVFGAAYAIGMVMCIVPGVLVGLMWWCYSYVLVDEDAPGVSCLSRAKELMAGHWLQVFLIALVGGLINQAAGSFCCLLQLFTQAYFTLLLAVTYVRISGQLTADELPPADDDEE